jgi:hypothetical protein
MDTSEIIIYQNKEGNIKIEVQLDEKVVCRNFRHTTQHGAMEGKTQETQNRWQHR